MKIMGVVGVLSPTNVYGGPATVATDQAAALSSQGHDVVLTGGALGFDELPHRFQGAPVLLSPSKRVMPGGFAGLLAPGLALKMWRHRKGVGAVHVHLARDLTTLPAALVAQLLGLKVFVQTHGMIDASDKPLAKVLDAVATRRVLRRAEKVFCLTDREVDDIVEVAGPGVRTEVIRNGIVTDEVPPDRTGDGPVEVLYLARLHERKRPVDFVRAAATVLERFPDTRFTLIGPDEGQGDDVLAAIAELGIGAQVSWLGARSREECREAMLRADIYVLPSVNEPFGMTVLEAMTAGLPVIVTNSCELGPAITQGGAGLVCEPGPAGIADALTTLVADGQERRRMGERAWHLVCERFSMDAVTRQLLDAYQGHR